MKEQNTCLAVMLKYPEPGRVKTRLGRVIGMSQAARLYRGFVLRLMESCKSVGYEVVLSCHPDRPVHDYKKWLGSGYRFVVQDGDDLGLNMMGCFERVFGMGFKRVVLVGSDLPHLSMGYMKTAIQRLESNDVVVGPARDGGYYLLGMSQDAFSPVFFQDISWSGPDVFSRTMEIVEDNNLKSFILPCLRDVDTVDDLKFILIREKIGFDRPGGLNRAVEELIGRYGLF